MADSAPPPPNTERRDPLLGTELGAYRIVEILGRGGFAVVYRAEQTQLGRDVALKVLSEGKGGIATEQVEAFHREARAAASLDHECLVHVHDVGEADGRHFLSMELVRGGSLARRLRRDGALAWPDALPILRDVALALQCAHENGMVHRDVKPGNILLTRQGRAKLVDLGLSAEKKHAGTPAFMAPEQILRRDVDPRTDLYAFGCTAFTMLTGSPPFERGTTKQVLIAHVRDEPPRITELVNVPREVERLILRCLEKDLTDRPASAVAVLDDLEHIGTQGSRLTRSERIRSRRTRPRRQPPSSSAGPLLVAVIVTLVLGVAALLVWRQLR